MQEVPKLRFWKAVEIASELTKALPRPLFQQLSKQTSIPPFIHAHTIQYHPEKDAFVVPDQMAQRVDLILGPHAKTVLRVWVIQVLFPRSQLEILLRTVGYF